MLSIIPDREISEITGDTDLVLPRSFVLHCCINHHGLISISGIESLKEGIALPFHRKS